MSTNTSFARSVTVWAVALTACGTFIYNVLLPLYSGKLEYENAELRAQVKSATRALETEKKQRETDLRVVEVKLNKANETAELLKKEIVLKDAHLKQAQLANLFVTLTPYPANVPALRVGGVASGLDGAPFVKSIDKDDPNEWEVKFEHSVFESAVLHIEKRSNPPVIEKITLRVKYSLLRDDDNFLLHRLTESLGPYSSVRPLTRRQNIYDWNQVVGLSVSQTAATIFIQRAVTTGSIKR